jgi:predicted 3-demethylubiquinone-9 3-methyltransferase (glyoxalase superfamily)
MTKITPCLWCDGTAEEQAAFYVGLVPDSRIDFIARAPSDNPSMREGAAMMAQFTLAGRPFLALNGGPQFAFNESISFQIHTDDQAETDRLWHAITSDGGKEGNCGWCTDRWGVSWQIVPRRLGQLMGSSDADAARRVSQAMLTMHRIDIAALEAAARGEVADA